MAQQFTSGNLEDEQTIRHIADLLFIYTDLKDWSAARQLLNSPVLSPPPWLSVK